MTYSTTHPPDCLKGHGLPVEALRLAVEVYNAHMALSGSDTTGAEKAAWEAVSGRFEKKGAEWTARDVDGLELPGIVRFRAARMMDDTGLKWEAILIETGLSLGQPRFYWSEEVLRASVGIFAGVDIHAYELTADYFSHLKVPDAVPMEDVKRYLTSKKVGWVEKTWFENGGIKGIIHFLPAHAWLPKTIRQGIEQGNDDVLGLSIDSRIRGMEMVVDGSKVVWVTQILSCSSVDVVTRPAAGGKFLRAAAGLEREDAMNREKLLRLILKYRPDLLEGKDRSKLNEDEILAMAQMAMDKPETGIKAKKDADGDPGKQAGEGEGVKRAAQDVGAGATGGIPSNLVTKDALDTALKEIETRAACARTLDTVLGPLPAGIAQRLRDRFTGKVFTQEVLDAAVQSELDYVAQMSAMPAFDIGDQGRASGGIGTRDKIEMAVDQLFGLTPGDITDLSRLRRLNGQAVFNGMRAAQDYESIPPLSGLRELYILLSGDTEIRGTFDRSGLPAELRAAQDITSTTFAHVLGNTLNRRLVKDYRTPTFNVDLLISMRKPVKDFRDQEAILVGYFGDLSDIDPESGAYQEIGAPADEESKYAIGQKGNILTVTRKYIINDDLSVLTRLVSRLGRAAARTHAQYVWNLWIGNATCSDGTAWFTAPHGNLGTAALSYASVLTAYMALSKMKEKDSGATIGLLDDPGVKPTLIYPVDLMETGEAIVHDDFYYTSNDLTSKKRNALKGKINAAQVSLLADPNDWGLLMPSNEVDILEMGYLNGRQEPEMFLADNTQNELVFTADKIRYKIRHEYAGAVVDYRSGYKAVVA